MKKSLFSGLIFMMIFSGCAKMYVDVKSSDYATFQLIPKSKTLVFSDHLTANISDYTNGCADMVELGYVYTDTDTPSEIVKIPVKTPLLLKLKHVPSISGAVTTIDSTDFILTAQKNKHYIVEFVKKIVNGKERTDFYVYMKNGTKIEDVPDSAIRNFNYRECM